MMGRQLRSIAVIVGIGATFAVALPSRTWGATLTSAPPAAVAPNDQALYGDDETHPIPYLNRLDIVAAKREGGVDLVIVIASPLKADGRSMKRLMRKLDTYAAYIASPDYRAQFGDPSPSTTKIKVVIDDKSDPAIFNWLEAAKPITTENQATLVVEKKSHAP